MRTRARRVLVKLLWTTALLMAAAAARYFFFPAATLERWEDAGDAAAATAFGLAVLPPLHPFSHHPALLSLHLVGGIVTMVCGLFQFVARWRQASPAAHRRLGYLYSGAVAVGSVAALPLSVLYFEPFPATLRWRLAPASSGLAALALAWMWTTAIAVYHARAHRYELHREWMLRSYSLTYSAVTLRLLSPVMVLLLRDTIPAANATFWSWVLNLLVVEWMIRRSTAPTRLRARAAAAGSDSLA